MFTRLYPMRKCRHMDMVWPSMEAACMDVQPQEMWCGTLPRSPEKIFKHGKVVHSDFHSGGRVLIE